MGVISRALYDEKMEESFQDDNQRRTNNLIRRYSLPTIESSPLQGYGQYGIGESSYDEGLYPQQIRDALEEDGLKGIDYLRGQRQPWYHKAGLGLTRSALSVGTKFGEGLGFVGALPFAGLEAAMGASKEEVADTLFDNFWVNAFAGMEQELKNQMPVYKSKKYTEGTLGQTLWTAEFWADDFMDGVAFMASAMIPGGIMSKAGLMGKTGLGMRFANALTKTKLGQLTNAGKDITKLANSLDLAGLTMYNTVSEAGFEAKDTYDMLINQGVSKDEAATSAFRTMALNGLVLLGPNALQQSFFFGKNGLVTPAAKQAIRKSIQDGSFKAIDDLFPSLKSKIVENVGKGIFAEGFVEEASQSAIQNYESKLRLNKEDWSASGLINQYIDGIFDDKDTQKALVIGSILGAVGGVRGALSEKKEDNQSINRIKAVSTLSNELFDRNIKTIYKTKQVPVEKKVTNTDGKETTVTEMEEKFVTDENGKPVIDPDKVIKLTKQLVYDKKLIDEAAVAEILGDKAGADMLTDLMLARSVYNYMSSDETGIGLEYFKTKLELEAENQKQLKPEEQDGISQILAEKLELINEFSNTYNNTVGMEKNTMIGKIKFFEAIKRSSLKRNEADTSALEQESLDFVDKLNEEFIKEQEKLSDEISKSQESISKFREIKQPTEEQTKNLTEEISKLDYLVDEYKETFGDTPLDVITEDEFIRQNRQYSEGLRGQVYSRFGNRYLSDTKVKAKLAELKNGEISEQEFFTIAIEEKAKGGIKEDTQKEIDNWFESRDTETEKTELNKQLAEINDSITNDMINGIPTADKEKQRQSIKDSISNLENKEKQITDLRNRFNSAPNNFDNNENLSQLSEEKLKLEAARNLIDRTFDKVDSNYNKDKENYTQIGAVNKAIEKLKAALEVFKERQNTQFVDLLEGLIATLETIREKVEANLRNRQAKQESFERNQAHNFYRGIGLEIDGNNYKVRDAEIFDIISEVIGKDKIEEILIDAASNTKGEEKIEAPFPIIHAKVILDLFKDNANAEQKKALLTVLKNKKNQVEIKHNNVSSFKNAPYKNMQLVLSENISIGVHSKSNPYIKFQNSNDPFTYLDEMESYKGDEFQKDIEEIKNNIKGVIEVLSYEDILEYIKSEARVEQSLEEEKRVTSEEYKFAPTNQQLYAIRKFFEKIIKPNHSQFISYLQGIAGSGKTSVVGDFLTRLLNIDEKSIITAAHTNWSSNNIKNSVTPNGVARTIEQLNSEINDIIEKEDIKIIVLDEVGGMDSAPLNDFVKKLTEINKKRQKENKGVISLLMLGDPTQLVKNKNNVDPTAFMNENLNILQAPTLNIVYRSNVSSIAEASSAFQSNPFMVEGLYVQTDSETNDIKPLGVNKLTSSQDIINSINKRIGNGRKKIIIVKDEQDKVKYESVLDKTRTVEYEGITQPEVEVFTVLEAQGRTIPEVYVDINLNIDNDFINNIKENKLIYTAISRASEYVGIIDYGNWFNEIQDKNIINDVARNEDEIKKSKEIYEDRIVEELSKIYQLKGIKKEIKKETKTQKPPSQQPSTNKPVVPEDPDEEENKPDTEGNTGVIVPEQPEEELPKEEGGETEGSYREGDNIHNLKFPTYSSSKVPPTAEEGRLQIPERAKVGSRVIYIKALRGGKEIYAILAETNKKNNYVEIGVMGEEEMNTSLGQELLKNAEGKPASNYVFNNDGIITLRKPNILKEGKLSYKKSLTYVYLKDSKYDIMNAIEKFVVGFFTKAGLIPDADNMKIYVKIFRNSDLKGDKMLPLIRKSKMKIQPGVPYLVIENPSSKNKKENTETSPQFIRLSPKGLSKTNQLLEPIMRYKAIIDELEKELPFKLGDDKFSTFINNFANNFSVDESGKIPTLVLKPESERIKYETVSEFVSEEQFTKLQPLINELIPLIYGPENTIKLYTEEEYQEFLKTTSLNKDLIEKVPIKDSDKFKVRYKVDEKDKEFSFSREYKPVRGKGLAQHNFNAIARANSSIRIKRNIPNGGKFIVNVFGKSLLDDRVSDGAYRAFLNELSNQVLQEKKPDGKARFVTKSNTAEFEMFLIASGAITKEELEEKKKELTNKPITSTTLNELFGDAAWNNEVHNTFRTPINAKQFNSIDVNFDEGIEKADSIIDSNLEEVIPTQIQVEFGEENKPIKATATAVPQEDVQKDIKNAEDELDNFFKPTSNLEMSRKNSTFAEDIEESKKAEELKKKCKE